MHVSPVIEQTISNAYSIYPDKKGLGLKQVQHYLAEKDESVTSADGLRCKSISVQGLCALEFVLDGTGVYKLLDKKGDFRYRYSAATLAISPM